MLIPYAFLASVAALVFLYKWDVWKSDALAQQSDKQRVQEELDKAVADREFYKATILALYQKPIYAVMTEEQMEKIAQLIAARMKEPDPWLN